MPPPGFTSVYKHAASWAVVSSDLPSHWVLGKEGIISAGRGAELWDETDSDQMGGHK